jgi:hypothetical protein
MKVKVFDLDESGENIINGDKSYKLSELKWYLNDGPPHDHNSVWLMGLYVEEFTVKSDLKTFRVVVFDSGEPIRFFNHMIYDPTNLIEANY